MEEYFGVVPCTIMSMMSDNLIPSACEVDVCGTISMHALRLGSKVPARCSIGTITMEMIPTRQCAFTAAICPSISFRMSAWISGNHRRDSRKRKYFRNVCRRVKPGAMSFARFSTDDTAGVMRGYVGEGAFTNDPLNTLGSGRGRNSAAPGPSALHLRKRF